MLPPCFDKDRSRHREAHPRPGCRPEDQAGVASVEGEHIGVDGVADGAPAPLLLAPQWSGEIRQQEEALPRLLVHLSTGSDNPTRAALAFLVARTALEGGHDVDVFLAGEAVSLLRQPTLEAVQGVGTGSLREHFDALVAGGARFYASRMSSNARALDAEAVGGKAVEFAPPQRLVGLVFEADRVLNY
jgi:predicted peroxiredoxin